jgi:uncharacterized membrane protein YGL010W
MNYSANKMAAKHCLSAQCIVVDIVSLMNTFSLKLESTFLSVQKRNILSLTISIFIAIVYLSSWRLKGAGSII